jgi:hypothetical protein
MIIIQGHIWVYISNLAIQISIKKSVINMGIQLYNRVPTNIKKLVEYKPCKRELKSFLIDHVFYSVEEFLCYDLMLQQLGLNTLITIFNAVYVQIVKMSNGSWICVLNQHEL